MPGSKAIAKNPGLPMCVTPIGNGACCKMPAIAKISGRFPTRHVCYDHALQAEAYYETEPLAHREDIVYLTARAKQL